MWFADLKKIKSYYKNSRAQQFTELHEQKNKKTRTYYLYYNIVIHGLGVIIKK